MGRASASAGSADSLKGAAGGEKVETSFTGYELNLQVGGDYAVNSQFSFGPYVMLSIAQFRNFKQTATPGTGLSNESGSITDKAVHEWLGFGVRGKFDL